MLTRDDLIGDHIDPYFGLILQDQTPVALDRVRFVGEPVAAVAALDADTAAEALELIDVEYEELPAVFDSEEALKPGRAACSTRAASNHSRAPRCHGAFSGRNKYRPSLQAT